MLIWEVQMVDVADCRSAAEVMEIARAVRERMKRMWEIAPPKPVIALPPDPPEREPKMPISTPPYNMREVAANLTEAYFPAPHPWAPAAKIDPIKRIVCEYYQVKHHDLIGKSRNPEFVRPRHVAMYLACVLTGKSLPEIGRRFGNRDHTSILFAREKIKALIATDLVLADEVRYLTARVRDRS